MFGIKYIKFEPSVYVLKYKKGKIVKEGAGLSFYYYAPSTSIVTVPIGSTDAPFMFEEITADFQSVSVQGQVTYRIVDHKRIAGLLNYTLDLRRRGYASDDPQKLPQRVINAVRVQVKKHLQAMSLQEAVKASESLANSVLVEIKDIEEIKTLGIEIMGLSVLAVMPNKETARALEAQAREQILKKADEAIYERRNAAIEQERIIKENEFNTEIAVEQKKRQVRDTQLEAERAVQQKQNGMKDEQMHFDTEYENKKNELVELASKNARVEADAKAYQLAATMKVFESMNPATVQALAGIGMQPEKLIALAFQGLADKAEQIGQLNITPDLLSELIRK